MVHEMARKAWSMRDHVEQHERPGREQGRHRRRHGAGREEHHHPDQHADGLLGAQAEGHHLPADLVGLVDHQHVVVVGRWVASASQLPRTSTASPGASTISPGPEVSPVALHRDDHEVAALGDHPREHRLRR